MPTLPCPACGVHGEIVLRGSRQATVGTVAVQLERRAVVACPSDHEMAPGDAVDAAMAATDAAVPRARKRLGRPERCGQCRAPLTMPVRRAERVVTVERAPVPVLTLHFDLPLTRCPDCGVDQLPTRSQEDLVVSVPAVFTAEQPFSG